VIEVPGVINIHDNIKPIKISPFVNTKKSWDNEEFKITPELKKGIKDGLNWENPSRIQAMAIPYIVNPDEDSDKYESLIAQAKNGAGKSGAFIIGSLLRVDPSINKVQVIIVGHTRELVNQIFSVISLIVEHTPSYRICNLATDNIDNSAHIFVSTLGTILSNISGRSKNLDLSELRVFVLDEADCFFLDKSRRDEILRF
jgi:superfamily II DNA/RNA helicase